MAFARSGIFAGGNVIGCGDGAGVDRDEERGNWDPCEGGVNVFVVLVLVIVMGSRVHNRLRDRGGGGRSLQLDISNFP